MRRRAVPEGIRITKVGLWYILVTLVVAIAATNTGNNSLYIVWAVLLAILVVSGLISRQNVRGLEATLDPPSEAYANRPLSIDFRLVNRSRFSPRWFVLFSSSFRGQPWLIPYLPRRGAASGQLEMIFERRGLHRIKAVHVSSLFPFGLFRKGARYPVDVEVLVYPEIFPAASVRQPTSGRGDDAQTRRRGWGNDLFALRSFRPGDDLRGVHWKRTARTGEMIYLERQLEERRRLSILLDNGAGPVDDEELAERFEHLVSEAATAAVDHLARDYEVELVTRDRRLPFASGPRQKLAILEHLARIEATDRRPTPLESRDPSAPELRVGLDLAPPAPDDEERAGAARAGAGGPRPVGGGRERVAG